MKGSKIFNKVIFQRTIWIDKNMLNEDTYDVSLNLISPPYKNPKIHLIIDNIIRFETAFFKDKKSVKGSLKINGELQLHRLLGRLIL